MLVSKVPALPPVNGDRDMLGLAVFNLLDNALKFTTPDDAIEVRVREDGRALFIEVADSGVGIPPQDQKRIFDDLYRGENARETEGSGLGLALARRIVSSTGEKSHCAVTQLRGAALCSPSACRSCRQGVKCHQTVTAA